jgi:outer membrane protein assembly factor BamD (BamD/ComL family)
VAATFSQQQRSSLHVLAYLYLRMGLFSRAERIYAALCSAPPAEGVDAKAEAALAFIALQDNAEEERDTHEAAQRALEHIRAALQGKPLASADAPLLLVQAQAFWMNGRVDEAKAAIEKYVHFTGGAR